MPMAHATHAGSVEDTMAPHMLRIRGSAIRIVGVAVSAGSIAAGVWMAWQILFPPDTSETTLPFVARLVIAFFTLEAVRMFAQVVIGATLYNRPSERPGTSRDAATEAPLVSIVVPAWNEAVGITKTLDSVLASTYPNVEVIVVDDGSTDDTAAIVAGYIERHPDKVVLVRQENAGKGEALNHGIRRSHGAIIVNVDADSFVAPTAIANLARRFEDPEVDAVVGQVVVGNRQTWVGLMQWLEYKFGFHLRRTQSVLNTIHILSGAMCAYRRSVYDRTPGFRDYSRTEDMDFSLMLRGLGGRLVYADDAVCVTEGASDLRGLHSQRVRWRYGAFSCLWRHRRLFFKRRRALASLAFYELPASMMGYLQVLLYPIIVVLALGLPIATGDYTSLVLILLALPLNFVIVFASDRARWTQWRYLLAVAVLMNVAMLVEHVAMIAAIHRHLTRRDLAWTNWTRQGAEA